VTETDRPFLTVVRGDATAEEIAALTAVLTAVGSRPSPDAGAGGRGRRSRWNDRAALLRKPVSHGRDAWLASARAGLG
jgi:hypothetical protein